MKVLIIVIILSIFLSFQSCFKIEDYPLEPKVSLIDFTFTDTVDALDNEVRNGTLHFSFVDGDGDIGFDTTSPQQNTIFLEKYKFIDGVLTKLDFEVPMNYYIPKFSPMGNNKALQGEIYVNDLNETKPFVGDTIMYTYYIVDRSGNKSNVDSTEFMIVY